MCLPPSSPSLPRCRLRWEGFPRDVAEKRGFVLSLRPWALGVTSNSAYGCQTTWRSAPPQHCKSPAGSGARSR